MNEYPKMMYRAGGSEVIHGAQLATRVVLDAIEQEEALADDWHLTTPEAIDAGREALTGNGTGAGPTKRTAKPKD